MKNIAWFILTFSFALIVLIAGWSCTLIGGATGISCFFAIMALLVWLARLCIAQTVGE